MGVRTTKSDEPDRLADRIWVEYSDVIYDQESFDKAYDDYMSTDLSLAQDVTLRKKAWERTDQLITRAGRIERKLKAEKGIVSGIAVPKHAYSFTAKYQDKVVYAYAQEITRRNKKILVYRDRKGHFVKRV